MSILLFLCYHHHPQHHYHHHQIVLTVWSSLTFSCYPSLSSSLLGCKSLLVGQHWHTDVQDIHKKMSLKNFSLMLQLFPVCFVCLTGMVCKMGGKWLYGYCFVGSCFQDLFKTVCAHLIIGVKPPTPMSILEITPNNLMVWLQ